MSGGGLRKTIAASERSHEIPIANVFRTNRSIAKSLNRQWPTALPAWVCYEVM